MAVGSVLLRVAIIYVYVLILVRLSGKRSVGQLSPFNFVMAILIADFIDRALSAEVPLLQGLTAITTLAAWHISVSYAVAHNAGLRRLLEDSQTPVIRQGQLDPAGLRQERTSRDEVLAELRLQKLAEAEIDQVREANWERTGQLSVLLKDEAKPAQKKDSGLAPPRMSQDV